MKKRITKKLFLFIVTILFLSINSHGQITQSSTIWKKTFGSEILNVSVKTDNNNVKSYTFRIFAQNSKYTHITDIICVYTGNQSEMCSFLSQIISFWDKYKDVSEDATLNIDNQYIFISTSFGFKTLSIHEKNKLGFLITNFKTIERIKKELLLYCNNNNIQVDCNLE